MMALADTFHISIHAPPRGATGAGEPYRAFRNDFNSRPSARGDPFRGREVLFRRISIHAPPRGATARAEHLPRQQPQFQFTPLREGRHDYRCVRRLSVKFQFTPLREGRRRAPAARTSALRHFNSRPSARGDADGNIRKKEKKYFNSRPSARGDAHSATSAAVQAVNFNSRPSARGDARAAIWLPTSTRNFNSRPSARGDPTAVPISSPAFLFQFTPLREGRQVACSMC